MSGKYALSCGVLQTEGGIWYSDREWHGWQGSDFGVSMIWAVPLRGMRPWFPPGYTWGQL